MVDQSFSRLVYKLDAMMAEAGYARSDTTTSEPRGSAGKDASGMRDMVATVYPNAHGSRPDSKATVPGHPRSTLTYREGGASQAS